MAAQICGSAHFFFTKNTKELVSLQIHHVFGSLSIEQLKPILLVCRPEQRFSFVMIVSRSFISSELDSIWLRLVYWMFAPLLMFVCVFTYRRQDTSFSSSLLSSCLIGLFRCNIPKTKSSHQTHNSHVCGGPDNVLLWILKGTGKMFMKILLVLTHEFGWLFQCDTQTNAKCTWIFSAWEYQLHNRITIFFSRTLSDVDMEYTYVTIALELYKID